MKGPVKILAGLSLLCASFLCACLNDSDELIIEGNYCTVRDGVTGLVSSEVSIVTDTLGNHDYIISNISGYPSASNAYRDVAAYLVGDNVLRIPEYEHVISNDVNLKIGGRGELTGGVIDFEIYTQRDETQIFELNLIVQDIDLSGKSFSDESQQISIKSEEMEFLMIDDQGQLHNFIVPFTFSTCVMQDLETDYTNEVNGLSGLLNMSIFYRGGRIAGEIEFSNDDWNSKSTTSFELLLAN